MDRRNALKLMGASLAAVAMAGIAPKTHAAILKDRAKNKKRLVFYFTATGNSLFVARQFSDAPLSIPQELKNPGQVYEADEIGFVFPDYASAAPLIVRDFLEKNTFKASYLFSIITFGNASAMVAEWWRDFAKEKGVNFDYINTILMVDNYLPVFDMNQQMAIDKHVDENLAKLLTEVGAQTSYIQVQAQQPGMPAMNADMLRGLQEQHFNMTADRLLELNKDKCVECMTCEKVCPHKNFSLGNDGLQFAGKCEYCLACVHACPQKALTLKSNWPGAPGERNPDARYRNPNVSLMDIIKSNRQ